MVDPTGPPCWAGSEELSFHMWRLCTVKISSMLAKQQFHILHTTIVGPSSKPVYWMALFVRCFTKVGTRWRHPSSSLALTRPRFGGGPSTCFIVDHQGLAIGFYICNAPSAPSCCLVCCLFGFVICASPGLEAWSTTPCRLFPTFCFLEIETLATTRSYVEMRSDV